MQVTIVGVSNENVKARIDDFESTADSESDGYRKGEIITVGRDYLWPQSSDGYLGKTE
jgi:hypothetical protein